MKEIVLHFQKLLALTCAPGQLKSSCLRANWELCSQLIDDISTTSLVQALVLHFYHCPFNIDVLLSLMPQWQTST